MEHDETNHIAGEDESCPACWSQCYCNNAGICLHCKAEKED